MCLVLQALLVHLRWQLICVATGCSQWTWATETAGDKWSLNVWFNKRILSKDYQTASLVIAHIRPTSAHVVGDHFKLVGMLPRCEEAARRFNYGPRPVHRSEARKMEKEKFANLVPPYSTPNGIGVMTDDYVTMSVSLALTCPRVYHVAKHDQIWRRIWRNPFSLSTHYPFSLSFLSLFYSNVVWDWFEINWFYIFFWLVLYV